MARVNDTGKFSSGHLGMSLNSYNSALSPY